ncbi:MAG: electron transport complex subunit RsxC [Clostridia bacterium]|nr:electron transport complex subunit RsxC [Clostridia bacterium]
MIYTFRGGIHMEEYKITADSPIEKMPAPDKVYVPLSQHIGAPCSPLVKVGDAVDKGQIIGAVEKGLGCPVHAPVSGKVTAIEEVLTPMGRKVSRIVIENDGEERLCETIIKKENAVSDITPEACVEAVRLAGISGMGGATFPTYAKISSALGKVNYLIINSAECEPFITADHRMMLEYPTEILDGIRILIKVFGLQKGVIAVEDNKLNAVEKLEKARDNDDSIEIRVMKTKYPQGDERQLIYALTGQELPAGKLPADVGCVIFNVETCYNIARAIKYGMPLIERVITVTGDCISTPKNLLAPLGTPMSELIEFCGGLNKKPLKLITGGPMMGMAQWDINSPITKGTNAILALSEKFTRPYDPNYACIHCGKCVSVCPMHLMPLYLAQFSEQSDLEMCEKFNLMSCVECGTCAYICPGSVPIVQFVRMTKAKINEEKRRQQALAAAEAEKAANKEDKKEESKK